MSDNSITQVYVELTTAATSQTTAPQITETLQISPQNALDVLFSALPTEAAASIASEYGISLQTRPTDTQVTSTSDTMDTSISSAPTSSAPSSSTSTVSDLTTTSSRTSQNPSMATSTTSTLIEPASATVTNAPTRDSQFHSGAVAGIATGVTAAVVFIILAALFLCRRRQQGKPLLRRSRSRLSDRAYPEVAWLYDPEPTPPRTPTQHSGGNESESETSLLPASPRPSGRGSMEAAALDEGRAPNMQMKGPGSPLLPPRPTSSSYGESLYESPHGSRYYSPRGSPERSGQHSPANGKRWSARSSIQSVRPMNAIYEEVPRNS